MLILRKVDFGFNFSIKSHVNSSKKCQNSQNLKIVVRNIDKNIKVRQGIKCPGDLKDI